MKVNSKKGRETRQGIRQSNILLLKITAGPTAKASNMKLTTLKRWMAQMVATKGTTPAIWQARVLPITCSPATGQLLIKYLSIGTRHPRRTCRKTARPSFNRGSSLPSRDTQKCQGCPIHSAKRMPRARTMEQPNATTTGPCRMGRASNKATTACRQRR